MRIAAESPRQKEKNRSDNFMDMVNMRIIAFIVIIVVIILALAYLIRIYTNKKESLKYELLTEASIVRSVVADHLSYSKNFLHFLSSIIAENYTDKKYVSKTLRAHFNNQKMNQAYGWRKYSWVDSNFNEIITSTRGIIEAPRKIDWLRASSGALGGQGRRYEFYSLTSSKKGDRLKIIDKLYDKHNAFKGALVLSYDLETLVAKIKSRKNSNLSNFVILDNNGKIIVKSSKIITNIVGANNLLDEKISKKIRQISKGIGHSSNHLELLSGLNFHIQPIGDGLPFYLVVNIGHDAIQRQVVDMVSKKFLEVSVYAILSFWLVVSIYKRETYLRSEAEKASEFASNAAKTRTDFLTYTAHEIRSPLGFISTSSDAMRHQMVGALNPRYLEYARGIHQSAATILAFIDDILDDDQIIEGKFKTTNNLEDIPDIINQSIKLNKARFNNREVEITLDIEPDLPQLICDKRRITQVISNLLSNGIKYSAQTAKILIKAYAKNDKLYIEVSDDGVGMDEEEVKMAMSTEGRVYKKSYSVGSYGLGLPIVKMLLKSHDAELKVKSKVGEGTLMRIIFPKYKIVYRLK